MTNNQKKIINELPKTVSIYVEGFGTLDFNNAIIDCFELCLEEEEEINPDPFSKVVPIIKSKIPKRITCNLKLSSHKCTGMFTSPDKHALG